MQAFKRFFVRRLINNFLTKIWKDKHWTTFCWQPFRSNCRNRSATFRTADDILCIAEVKRNYRFWSDIEFSLFCFHWYNKCTRSSAIAERPHNTLCELKCVSLLWVITSGFRTDLLRRRDPGLSCGVLCDHTFSRFCRTPTRTCDGQMDGQTDTRWQPIPL